VRLLLDANLSGRRIARPLREDGHDVEALSDRPDLEGLADPEVLALAAAEERILVTRNSRDFAPLLREWAEAGRPHAGCVLIWTLKHDDFGPILEGIRRLLAERPEQSRWRDVAVAL
jgi:predicted nuclease of predicted toxin-antitoxin system